MSSSRQSGTAFEVRNYIVGLPLGRPFGVSQLLAFGTRAAVDQALSRLAKAGRIERLARGVYVRPQMSAYVGKVIPGPFEIVQTIARERGEVVQLHGAEAARRFGFSTQVPAQPVYLTSGASRNLQLGNLEVTLRKASPRKLAHADRPMGLALTALRYLGKDYVTAEHLQAVERQLEPEEFDALRAAWGTMPGWLADKLRRYESMATHA